MVINLISKGCVSSTLVNYRQELKLLDKEFNILYEKDELPKTRSTSAGLPNTQLHVRKAMKVVGEVILILEDKNHC